MDATFSNTVFLYDLVMAACAALMIPGMPIAFWVSDKLNKRHTRKTLAKYGL